MEGSRELIEDLRKRDIVVVLASSAKDWEVEHYLDLLDAEGDRRRLDDLRRRRADEARARPDQGRAREGGGATATRC